MKAKLLLQWATHTFLLANILVGNLMIPPHAVSARPLASMDCTTQSEIAVPECQALVALYDSTGGANWTTNTNWLSTTPCSWYGITCVDTGTTPPKTVSIITLTKNKLIGTIPAELGSIANANPLPNLDFLDLHENSLTSSIPATLGNLTSLRTLDLHDNLLQGSIPPELGTLTNLRSLNLSINKLDGSIPSQLGNLTNLTGLILNGNGLDNNLPVLSTLTKLKLVYLGKNQLTGDFPAQFTGISSIVVLDLANNSFKGNLPESLNTINMPNLQGLYLSNNQFDGHIPDALGDMTTLTSLALDSNKFDGQIPAQLNQLTSLQVLDLDTNQLSGLIPDLSALSQLTLFDVHTNKLSGGIPSYFNNTTYPSLITLSLDNNSFTGSIPPTNNIGTLTTLQYLALNNNHLDGTIPDLGALTQLQHLSLNSTYLSGDLSGSGLGSLVLLENLQLGNTLLEGDIPSGLANFSKLGNLTLSCGLTTTPGSAVDTKIATVLDDVGWDTVCPPNDNFNSALAVSSLPYSDHETMPATTPLDDPTLPCGPQDQGLNSVWYVYTPSSGSLLGIDTFTSNYDTTINVWTGSSPANLVNVACNDDNNGSQSQIIMTTTAGQTYYIEVTGTLFGDIADLNFHMAVPTPFTSCSAPAQTQIPAGECNYLVTLYNNTNGASWTNRTNWLAINTPCSWFGVVCDAGRVTGLNLPNNNLVGTLPTGLNGLGYLLNVDLSNNHLIGSIPTLSGLSFVIKLNLSNNQLSGGLPAGLTSIHDLEDLRLDNNSALGGSLPTLIGDLEQLKTFHFANTALSGQIPSSFTRLTLLTSLTVSCGVTSSNSTVINFITNIIGPNWDTACPPTPTPTRTPTPRALTFVTTASQDGWVRESSETSNKGGTLNVAGKTLYVGDDAQKRQYRSVLSFKTAPLPDTAVIVSITLKLKKSVVTGGGNPITTFKGFMVDIKKGTFGTAALQTADFQTTQSKSYGPFKPTAISNWYTIDLTAGKAYINKLASASGLTQIRLRFKLDDNNNTIANYLQLFSGNAPAASRPQLIIKYYLGP